MENSEKVNNLVFSGVQPTGNLHLGNYLGAIKNWIELQSNNNCIFCIVDLHALTTSDSRTQILQNTREVAAAYIASGINPKKTIIFVQSNVTGHSELAWILSCHTPIGWLNRMTQFKDKAGKNKERAPLGLYSYPVLMAADILLYDAELVPVGKDQKQHIEMTRDVATKFNLQLGETFVIPKEETTEKTKLIPGTDGHKMSKSRNNLIDIFLPEKKLRKQIMSIVSNSEALEDSKNPDNCTIFALYSILANEEAVLTMRANYEKGGYGYGHAKQALYELIIEKFKLERERYNYLMEHKDEIDKALSIGAKKAKVVALKVLNRVRHKVGYANT